MCNLSQAGWVFWSDEKSPHLRPNKYEVNPVTWISPVCRWFLYISMWRSLGAGSSRGALQNVLYDSIDTQRYSLTYSYWKWPIHSWFTCERWWCSSSLCKRLPEGIYLQIHSNPIKSPVSYDFPMVFPPKILHIERISTAQDFPRDFPWRLPGLQQPSKVVDTRVDVSL